MGPTDTPGIPADPVLQLLIKKTLPLNIFRTSDDVNMDLELHRRELESSA